MYPEHGFDEMFRRNGSRRSVRRGSQMESRDGAPRGERAEAKTCADEHAMAIPHASFAGTCLLRCPSDASLS